MTVSHWTEADSNRVQQLWLEYQQHHVLSEKISKIHRR